MKKISIIIVVLILILSLGCSDKPITGEAISNKQTTLPTTSDESNEANPSKPNDSTTNPSDPKESEEPSLNSSKSEEPTTTSSPVLSDSIDIGIRYEYYKFGRKNRLDYVPFFEEGNTPSSSPEYLYYAFAINLINWGEDKGTMTREYVEHVARNHFEVENITHESLQKGWDYDGENYTAHPQGIKEYPIFILQDFKTYNENGRTIYEIAMDNCVYGLLIPDFEINKKVHDGILSGDLSEFRLVQTESFKYYLDKKTGDIVFLSHTIVQK